jgi:hypothetical protein
MSERTVAILIAILETLNETDGGPESSIYLAMGCDMSAWEVYRGILVAADWVSIAHHWVSLTDKGRALCADLTTARK